MMQKYLMLVLAAFAHSQTTIDQTVLDMIYKKPQPADSNTISVKLKAGITSYVDDKGQEYVCTPQYPHNSNIGADGMANSRVTGCGLIDERIGEDDDYKPCVQLVDSVCTMVTDSMKPTPPPAVPAVLSVPTVQVVPRVQAVPTVPAVLTVSTPTVPTVPTVQAVPPVQAVSPVQAVPPVQALPPVQAVLPVQAVPPVQAVLPVEAVPAVPSVSTVLRGCGYRNRKGLGDPSNNTETQFGEFPWVVALLNSSQEHYIGVGALISPEVVVTAAHVVSRLSSKSSFTSTRFPDWLKVRAGNWDLRDSKEIYGYQERCVKEVYILNEFSRTKPRHDIALLLLDQPLELTDHINVICLPEQDEVFDRQENCVSNSWDQRVYDAESHNKILRKLETDIVPYTRCLSLVRRTSLGSNFKLHPSFICAREKETTYTYQTGGAPLACPIGNDRYKLTGLFSWGVGRGHGDIPGIYTNVPQYRQWVDKKLANWGLQNTWYRYKDNN